MQGKMPPQAKGLVMVDFDGTIVPWGELMGWKVPFDGVQEAMADMREAGYRIGIFTSRMSTKWCLEARTTLTIQHAYVSEILQAHGIPYDFITGEKLPAMAYFDDMAVHVPDGELASLLNVWRSRQGE